MQAGFSAVDHCDACCVGIHVAKTGNGVCRLAADCPGPAGRAVRPAPMPGAGLRTDHGTHADDFLDQIKF